MAISSNMDQHLEMMLNKKNRCEDWVNSVTLTNHYTKQDAGLKTEEELSEVAEGYSDDVCVSSDGPRKRTRKLIVNERLPLILNCEWHDCDFGATQNRTDFLHHVATHITDVPVIQKPDGNRTHLSNHVHSDKPHILMDLSDCLACYQCSWGKCGYQCVEPGVIKRHIHFHAYHATLKATASCLNDLWELPRCALIGENINWPDLDSPYRCEIATCGYETDVFITFINHVNSHIDILDLSIEPVISCKWKGCTKFKCRKKTFMKIHMRHHTGEKSIACSTCGAMFTSNTKYMDHCSRKVPVQDESNQCQYCLRYYPNDRLLRDHMRYHINSQKCSFCEMTFSTPAVLANHVHYKHIKDRPFWCTHCSHKAVKAKDYNAHLSTHVIEPKYRCDVDSCDYSCRCISTLKKHVSSVHRKTPAPVYKCHLCEREYNRGPSLGCHLRAVHKLERLPCHSRFRYMKNKDGYYRLQVERYESLELNNFKGPSVSIKSDMNFNIKEQPTDDEMPRKFEITVNENQNEEPQGLIVRIGEQNVHNDMYSTTFDSRVISVNETRKEESKDLIITPDEPDVRESIVQSILVDDGDINKEANQNENPKESIITIDELDIHGNVVYSTTVDKELMNNKEFFFVDVENLEEPELDEVNEPCIIPDPKKEMQLLKSTLKRKRRTVTLSDYNCINGEQHIFRHEE